MIWEPRSGIFLGTWYVYGHSFFYTQHLFCEAHDYFSLRINVVKNYFVNYMSGPYFGWLKHFRRMYRMMTTIKIL